MNAVDPWRARWSHPITLAEREFLRRCASVDTHAERCDVKQAQPARVGSAVAATGGETPKGSR